MKASTVSTQESEVSTESSCLVETQTGVESGVSTSTFDLTEVSTSWPPQEAIITWPPFSGLCRQQTGAAAIVAGASTP